MVKASTRRIGTDIVSAFKRIEKTIDKGVESIMEHYR